MADNEELVQECAEKEPRQDEAMGDRVVELENLLAAKEGEIGEAKARVSELERALAVAEGRLSELNGSLKQAVSSYRVLVVQSHADVPEELIKGDSIEEINHSLKSARELASRIKTSIEADMASARVPAGAPQRASFDLSALSPREKINLGIEKGKS